MSFLYSWAVSYRGGLSPREYDDMKRTIEWNYDFLKLVGFPRILKLGN